MGQNFEVWALFATSRHSSKKNTAKDKKKSIAFVWTRMSVSSKRPSASDVPQNARSIPFNRKTH